MARCKELKIDELKLDFKGLKNFDTTLDIKPFEGVIGQERAVEAIELGILMNRFGFNIFISGNTGSGKRSYIINKLNETADRYPVPDDWCYVYNFEEPLCPIAVSLKAGTAEEFRQDIEDFLSFLFEKVPKAFSDELYEKERTQIIDKYQKEILRLADKLFDESKDRGFSVKSTGEGFAFVPLKDEEEMSERQYNELSEEEKDKINNLVSDLKLLALETMRKTKSLKKGMGEELKVLDDSISIILMENEISRLKGKYGYSSKAVQYIDALREDITENIDAFMDTESQIEKYDEGFFKRYFINVIICNKDLKGAPVVFEDNPEYHSMLGIVEYENKSGTLISDFSMIKAGSLHRANGGFIVIDALQLLKSYQGWEALKRCLKSGSVDIENLKNQFDIIPLVSLKPEEIPLKVKVVLLGTSYIYYLLYQMDEDFKELFGVKAEFEDEFKGTDENIEKLIGYISNYCLNNGLLPVTRDGINELLRYSMRLANSKNYFNSRLRDIGSLLEQAHHLAEEDRSGKIDRKHINDVLGLMERRHALVRDRVLDMYRDKKYIVELSGYASGQINALSVIDYGDFVFGKQNRVTVATFAGRGGIVNIEREADMSGNIHSKGIMILAGFLGERYGQSSVLSFNASICFEQLYGEIDGDSASAAELIALLSSLGDIPIKQSVAVTGSVNQKGDIQPVGGLTHKIEGFYDICKIYGLDGSHGVILPQSNVDELVLKDEVLVAVEKGLFHIYAVSRIEECFEILCSPGDKTRDKKSIMEYIDELVKEKLNKFNSVFSGKAKK